MIIGQGRDGSWQVTQQYTLEKDQVDTSHIFYLLLGHLGRILDLSNIFMYHSAIIFSLILFYIFTYLLVSVFFKGLYKYFVLYLIYFTGPFPKWEVSILGQKYILGSVWWSSMEIYERLYHVPHHFFAISCLVGCLYFLIKFLRENKLKYAVVIGVLSVLGIIFFSVPLFFFLILLLWIILFTLINFLKQKKLSISKNKLFTIVVIFLISLAVFITTYLRLVDWKTTGGVTALDLEYKTYLKEIYPNIYYAFVLSHSISLPLGLPAIYIFLKKKRNWQIFIVPFMAILPHFVYFGAIGGLIPISKHRLVYSAPYVFWGILAGIGIKYLIVKNRIFKAVVAAMLVVIIISNTYLSLDYYWAPKMEDYFISSAEFIPKFEMNAMNYLRNFTQEYSHIIAIFNSATYLPAFTSNRLYLGHEWSTLKFWEKWPVNDKFMMGKMNSEEAEKFLEENRISYIFWNVGKLPIDYQSLMKPVFNDGYVTVYKTIY
jgi:hypothetical protein